MGREQDTRWALTDESLRDILDRVGARPRDVEFASETREDVPYRGELQGMVAKSRRDDREPIIWVDYEDSMGNTQSLVVTLTRFWAQADPVKSIIQFMRQWMVVDHVVGKTVPLTEGWEKTHSKAKRNDKKWALYTVWPDGTDEDGVCIADVTWFVADPAYCRDREARL
jgi:hypothetical protein